MSFFGRRGIPDDILKLATIDTQNSNSNSSDSQTDGTLGNDLAFEDETALEEETAFEDDTDFEDDVAILEDYCLVTTDHTDNTGHTFEMHGLVQLSTRRWLKDRGLDERFTHEYIRLMDMAFPWLDYGNWAEFQRLNICHVEAVVHHRPVGRVMEVTRAALLYRVGYYASQWRVFGSAELMLRASKNALAELYGERHWKTISATVLYARALVRMGRLQEAEYLLVRARDCLKLKFGPNNHDQMIFITDGLTDVYSGQGRSEEAMELYAHLLATLEMTVGDNHLDTWRCKAKVANIYLMQGDLDEAKKLLLKVVEVFKTRLGDDDPQTLHVTTKLATTLSEQGLFEEAKNLFLKTMEAYKRVEGVSNPATLDCTALLALTLFRQGLLEDATKLGAEVLGVCTRCFGVDHPDTLSAMESLAITLRTQGSVQNRDIEALELMRKCAEARERVLGPQHPDTLSAWEWLETWGA
jgi:tetratricopeptide (TPR) repeat protein